MTMYAITYTGAVSGSPGGRDDGYPETKIAFNVSVNDLYNYQGKRDVKIYKISELDHEQTNSLFKLSFNNKEKRIQQRKEAIAKAKSKLTPDEKRLLGVK